MFFYS